MNKELMELFDITEEDINTLSDDDILIIVDENGIEVADDIPIFVDEDIDFEDMPTGVYNKFRLTEEEQLEMLNNQLSNIVWIGADHE